MRQFIKFLNWIKWKQKLISLSQFVNVWFLNGYADETLSARAYRQRFDGRFWFILWSAIDLIFFFDKDHCAQSYLSETVFGHLPREYSVNA